MPNIQRLRREAVIISVFIEGHFAELCLMPQTLTTGELHCNSFCPVVLARATSYRLRKHTMVRATTCRIAGSIVDITVGSLSFKTLISVDFPRCPSSFPSSTHSHTDPKTVEKDREVLMKISEAASQYRADLEPLRFVSIQADATKQIAFSLPITNDTDKCVTLLEHCSDVWEVKHTPA